jgi:hypothetical protein
MPKNIYLIKESLAKIEEVREIDNKVLSYEEFMKTYEADERVVNSYEDEVNHVNVWVPKGVGPCSWNNPNCECYLSQGFVLLKVPCPTNDCSSTTISNWFHSSGGYLLASSQTGCGTLVVSSSGRIKCSNCGTEGNWKDWKFSCSSHLGRYNQMDAENFIEALSISMKLYANISPNRKRIIGELVRTLMSDY